MRSPTCRGRSLSTATFWAFGRARSDGAYLEGGTLWLCLSLDADRRGAADADYSHIAFDVAPDDFDPLAERVSRSARIWKDNRSEGPSLYFLDPDGHRLELHVGGLAERLAHYGAKGEGRVKILEGS